MGAITRSVANNITTSGVILPAGINDASVASITALAQVSAGDGITLISSQTASASASLSFTGIDSTYRTYLFKFINIHPSTQAEFKFNLSTDGGSSYNVAKTTTYIRTQHDEADTTTELSYDTGRDAAQSTSALSITLGIGSESDSNFGGYFYLFNPSSTTYVKHFIINISNTHVNTYANQNLIAGYGNTTSAINAVQFTMSSGNIDAGTIHMYGIT
jgi:hypothetical protein